MVGGDVIWSPSDELKGSLHLTQLMDELGYDFFEELHDWSVNKPEKFWAKTIERLGIQFHTPYSQLLNVDDGVSKARWLVGAKMNIAQSCFQGDLSRPAIITKRYDGRMETLSFETLDKLSNRVAGSLASIGIRKGDAVAIDMAMTAEAVAIYLGLIKAGVAAISIPDSFPEVEIEKRLRLGQAKAIFTQDIMPRGEKKIPMYPKVKAAAGELPIIVWPALGDMHAELTGNDQAWDDFLHAEENFEAVACDPDDIITIIFSSGTTGDPKAIPWMQHTPIKCGSDAHWHHNITLEDVVCWPTSLGWMMGPWLIFASYLNGAPIALYEGGPVERAFCEFVVDAKVTMMGLVPSIAKGWRASGCADGLDFSTITRYSSSGEASNADDYAWLMGLNQPEGKLVPVVEYCGGTEIAGGYLSNNLVKPGHPAQFNGKTLGIDFVLLTEEQPPACGGKGDRIAVDQGGARSSVDTPDRAPPPAPPQAGGSYAEAELDTAGELFIIPPSIGLSTRILNRDNEEVYYKDCPTWQGKTLRRHGDRIIRLADHYYCSDGRADNAMNLGGIKIGSAEIERVINTVDGVTETAAIGIPPPGGGPDQLVVYAVTDGTPDVAELKGAMQQVIKTTLNPLFKLHDVILIDALPRTASNKVMHRELKVKYQESSKAA